MHKKGKAFDIRWPNNTQAGKEKFITNAIKAGFSGIGIYPTFMHMDIGTVRAWGANGSGTSLPAWASAVINRARLGGGNSPLANTNDGSITQPPGSMYIPGMGTVENGSQQMQLLQKSNADMMGGLNGLQTQVNTIAQKNIVKQDGNLKGVLPMGGSVHTDPHAEAEKVEPVHV